MESNIEKIINNSKTRIIHFIRPKDSVEAKQDDINNNEKEKP